MNAKEVKTELRKFASKEKALFYPKFFKAGKGEYAEGDKFIGVTVPYQRLVAKKFSGLTLSEIRLLLKSKVHEHRLTALFILVNRYKKASDADKELIYKFYLANTNNINNWDLVDSTASYIIGNYIFNNPNYLTTINGAAFKGIKLLEYLARSDNLWERRIAMLGAGEFIKHDKSEVTLKIAELLQTDKQDLIHKAVGWMLREVGKNDVNLLEGYLNSNYSKLSRTTLRYAIEKFSKNKRMRYLNLK